MTIPQETGSRRNPDSPSLDRLKKLEPGVNIIACFILAASFLFWDASRAVYVLFCLASFVWLIIYRPKMPRDHRLYSWPIIIFLGVTVLSLLFHGVSDSGVNRITSRFMLLLLAVPIAVTFFVTYDENRNAWMKFALASIVLGTTAYIEFFYLDKASADSGHNQAIFGMTALSMTAIVIASYEKFTQYNWGRIFFCVSILLGLSAVLLSTSRTSWFSSVIIIAIAGYFLLDRYSRSKRLLIVLVSIATIATVAATQPRIQARFDNMVEMITPYLKGEEQTRFNNLRYRVEIWKMGWQVGMENKLFGYGPGDTKRVINRYAAEYPQYQGLEPLRNFHNQFIQSFAMCGIPGLISYLLLVVCHFWLFFKYLDKRYSREVRMLALSGLLLVMVYFLKAFLGVSFYNKQQILVYGIASAAIWGTLAAAVSKSPLSLKSDSA